MKSKYYRILTVALAVCGFVSCDLTETPKFPSDDTLFETVEGANTVLNGCYEAFIHERYYGSQYWHLEGMASGLFNTNRDASLINLISLRADASDNFVSNLWTGAFRAVMRCNNMIDRLEESTISDVAARSDMEGQARFLRAVAYFDLVRIYGRLPIYEESYTSIEVHQPRAETIEKVYDFIIKDLKLAEELLPMQGSQTLGRPASEAASMMLAKVYMQMAGNKTATETTDWQNAWDCAIKAYGKYSLVSDYTTLWRESTSDNTLESVFEIQSSEEYTIQLVRMYSPSNSNRGQTTWGRLKPNLEVYNLHVATYVDDPRIKATFLTNYPYYNNGAMSNKTRITYGDPSFNGKRNNKHVAYPFVAKYYIEDHTRLNDNSTKNYVKMRYAELLLMLAEIENEINGPANAYQYVNEVLARARQSGDTGVDPADWSGMTQENFRQRIMKEYQFELLGEGEDFYRVRRRGWEYFKTNVVDAHNNFQDYDFDKWNYDVILDENPRSMIMPVPQTEIIANPYINQEDQNLGY